GDMVGVSIGAQEELATLENGVFPRQGDGLREKLEDVLMLAGIVPMEPTDLVVLAVSVIVPLLSPHDLVTSQDHRRACREEETTGIILDQLFPEMDYLSISGFTLRPAIP